MGRIEGAYGQTSVEIAPSRATTLPASRGGATQIGSKRTFQIKLRNGLTSSRVQTTFAVHARLIVRADST